MSKQCLECGGSGTKNRYGDECQKCRGTGQVQPPRPGYAPGVRWVVTGPDDQNGGAVAARPELLTGKVKDRDMLMNQAYLTAAVDALNDAQKWTPGNWKIELETCEVWTGE